MTKRILWSGMVFLAIGVALYALALLVVPAARPPFVQASPMPWAFLLHISGGGLALAIGPFQFRASQRARRPRLHRWMGRTYVTAILAGGTAGLLLAFVSQGGMVAHTGFGLLAILWVATTTAAFLAIRRGDVVVHQRWMTRSFALTLAAVTLRIYLPVSQAAGIPFEIAYPIIAWACWLPNLLVAEWRFVPRTRIESRRPALA
jgi:uncharacterized membrane protein